jgi:Putative cytokine, C6ORF120
MEGVARDKHSSLLRKFVNYGCKKFYNIVSRTCGLDRIQVPRTIPRPLHIAVYGHPRYEVRSTTLKLVGPGANPLKLITAVIYRFS